MPALQLSDGETLHERQEAVGFLRELGSLSRNQASKGWRKSLISRAFRRDAKFRRFFLRVDRLDRAGFVERLVELVFLQVNCIIAILKQ